MRINSSIWEGARSPTAKRRLTETTSWSTRSVDKKSWAERDLPIILALENCSSLAKRCNLFTNAPYFRQILIRLPPQLFRHCKLLSRFGAIPRVLHRQSQRKVPSRIAWVVLNHLLRCELRQIPIVCFSSCLRDAFQFKATCPPRVRAGHGTHHLLNLLGQTFPFFRFLLAQQNVGP